MKVVDAASFDGYNLGRFANQGGLQEGRTQLALDLKMQNVQQVLCASLNFLMVTEKKQDSMCA